MTQDQDLLVLFQSLALAAGRRIMEIKEQGCATETKADESPVTLADREGEAIILAGLRAARPDLHIIAEEEAAAGLTNNRIGDEFVLVDPLDGTKEFINGSGDFTVNIALIRKGAPVLGVVYAPVSRQLYTGIGETAALWSADKDHNLETSRPIRARKPAVPFVIVASRSHRTPETDEIIARHPGAELVSVGSSLKFCLLAAGEADLYPRLSPTMQWDTAAGDAVLRAAGGRVSEMDGAALRYGDTGAAKPFLNPWFIAEGER